MAALDPIAGITLEQYADLCAQMTDTGGDLDKCAAVASRNGVDRDTWEAAMNGWNARMADPETAGAVALAYHPLYQAALAKHGAVSSATFEEYVAMSAMLRSPRFGMEPMLAHFKLNLVKWSQISTHWVTRLTKDPQLSVRFSDACTAELARLGDGGAPPPSAR